MAGTTVDTRVTSRPSSAERNAVIEHNKVVTDLESLSGSARDGVLQIGTLAISAGDATDFKTTTVLYWRRLGIQFTKAATDTLSFSAANTINTAPAAGFFFGSWLVNISDTGTFATQSVGADQVYTTAALALAAAQALTPTAGTTAVGYITIGANTGASWTANTDDMTPASDCVSATFTDATALTIATDAADMTAAQISESGTVITA